MSLTLIVIVLVAWLLAAFFAWTLLRAAARGDAKPPLPETATPPPPLPGADPRVYDTGALRRKLGAARELVGAVRVVLSVRTRGRGRELAAVPPAAPIAPRHASTRIPHRDGVDLELTAYRALADPPFDALDEAVLEALLIRLAVHPDVVALAGPPDEVSPRFTRDPGAEGRSVRSLHERRPPPAP